MVRPGRQLAFAVVLVACAPSQAFGAGTEDRGSTDAPPRWSDGRPRPFLAVQAELGSTQHARAVAGFGKPWWLWGGLLLDGWANLDQATGTVGARVALLAVNLDVHWRTTRQFARVPMTPEPRHTDVAQGEGSTLHAWDFDVWGVVPTPGGYVTWEGQATRLLGLPPATHVFDEGVHAIVGAPWSGLVSLGWLAELAGGDLLLGAAADLTFLGRGGDRRLRAGPALSWSPSPRWTLRAQTLATLSGPDALPFFTGLGGGVVVGYRTATGAAHARAALP